MTASLIVVDDEPINLEIIGEYLMDTGYKLSLFEDPVKAWKALEANPDEFDLVVMDRMMPGLDGMALLKLIKGDARTRHLPVIMQTAAASPDQVGEGLAAGAYYYLTKPFRAEALLSIVRAALHDGARRADLAKRIANHAAAMSLLTEGSFTVHTLDEAEMAAGIVSLAAVDSESVALGLAELLVNGIEHGNLGIDFQTKAKLKSEDRWLEEVLHRQSQPEYQGRAVHMHLRRSNGEYIVVVEDDGEGFDWVPFLELAPERAFAPNGRGIAVSRQLCFNNMQYKGKGNVVEVSFAAASPLPLDEAKALPE